MKMKNTILLGFLCFFTVAVKAQKYLETKGIKFEHGLTWQQIKAKSENENRLVFIDCNASWCKPCKEMEVDVFSDSLIGDFFNDNFVSVKVQLDTSKSDNEEVKRWYADAHSIMKRYNVSAFPTFLFLSPDGKIVHKGVGYKNINNFLALAKDACNPNRQYYTLLDQYNRNPNEVHSLAYLARLTYELGDPNVAENIARKYINELEHKEIYTKEVIEFLRQFTKDEKDRAFKIFFKNAHKINEIMENDDYVQGFIADIIMKKELKPFLNQNRINNRVPNWEVISNHIKSKYNGYYANRTIAWAKVSWYSSKKDWSEYTKYLVKAMELSSADTRLNGYFINNNAWFVFERSNNSEELNAAILWMEHLFKNVKDEAEDPQSIDTYANLLYKVGRIDEAINWEQKAVAIEKEHAKISQNEPDSSIAKNLAKMQKSEPTWGTK